MTRVSLREWETARPEPGSVLAHQSLAAYPIARRLAEELTKTGRMEVLELTRGLELREQRCIRDFRVNCDAYVAKQKTSDKRFATPTAYANSTFTDLRISQRRNGASKTCSYSSSLPKPANCSNAAYTANTNAPEVTLQVRAVELILRAMPALLSAPRGRYHAYTTLAARIRYSIAYCSPA